MEPARPSASNFEFRSTRQTSLERIFVVLAELTVGVDLCVETSQPCDSSLSTGRVLITSCVSRWKRCTLLELEHRTYKLIIFQSGRKTIVSFDARCTRCTHKTIKLTYLYVLCICVRFQNKSRATWNEKSTFQTMKINEICLDCVQNECLVFLFISLLFFDLQLLVES